MSIPPLSWLLAIQKRFPLLEYGIAHGPIITFDSSFARSNTNEISSIRVYALPRQ
jgi:hypothetical protein